MKDTSINSIQTLWMKSLACRMTVFATSRCLKRLSTSSNTLKRSNSKYAPCSLGQEAYKGVELRVLDYIAYLMAVLAVVFATTDVNPVVG